MSWIVKQGWHQRYPDKFVPPYQIARCHIQKTLIFIVIVVCTSNPTWLGKQTHTHTHTQTQEGRVPTAEGSPKYDGKITVFRVLTPCIPFSEEPAVSVFKFHQPEASSFSQNGSICQPICGASRLARGRTLHIISIAFQFNFSCALTRSHQAGLQHLPWVQFELSPFSQTVT
jgi:hypothetical protein